MSALLSSSGRSAAVPRTMLRAPRLADHAIERARLAVVPRGAPRAPRVPFAVLVGLLLVGGVAGLLLFNTSMQKSSFRATTLEQRAESLRAEEQELRMELDRIRDPQALAERARALGMVPPDAPAFLRLGQDRGQESGHVTGEAAPSTGANAFGFGPRAARKPKVLDPVPVVVRAAREGTRSRGASSGRGGG